MTTAHDWNETIFELTAPPAPLSDRPEDLGMLEAELGSSTSSRPPSGRWRVPALVVLVVLVLGSLGVVVTTSTSQPEEPTVPRPARRPRSRPAPAVKVEAPTPIVVETPSPAPMKPVERKRRPAADVLGERL